MTNMSSVISQLLGKVDPILQENVGLIDFIPRFRYVIYVAQLPRNIILLELKSIYFIRSDTTNASCSSITAKIVE